MRSRRRGAASAAIPGGGGPTPAASAGTAGLDGVAAPSSAAAAPGARGSDVGAGAGVGGGQAQAAVVASARNGSILRRGGAIAPPVTLRRRPLFRVDLLALVLLTVAAMATRFYRLSEPAAVVCRFLIPG